MSNIPNIEVLNVVDMNDILCSMEQLGIPLTEENINQAYMKVTALMEEAVMKVSISVGQQMKEWICAQSGAPAESMDIHIIREGESHDKSRREADQRTREVKYIRINSWPEKPPGT